MKINGLYMINKYYELGFYIKYFLKDLNLVIELSVKYLEVIVKVWDMLEVLVDNYYENKGI